jgi:hypothetical protein
MKSSYLSLLVTLSLLKAGIGISQNVQVSAVLDTNAIRIGEQAIIHLRVQSPKNNGALKISWPLVSDSLIKSIVVIKVSKIDTTKFLKNSQPTILQQEQSLVITSFDSGYYALPPFKFILNNDSTKPLLTEALLLHVQGMRVDTTLAIKDIKQPLKEPFNWRELIPLLKWVALVLVLLVGTVLLVQYLSRRKQKPLKLKGPEIPPHIQALEALRKLQEAKLWQDNKQKEYHSRLTDILRLYIEQRFHISAMEQTSDEILNSFRSIAIEPENKARLKQILLLSDMVKFAKQQAMSDENEMSLDNAIAFVSETRSEHRAFETKQNPQN